MSRILLIGRRGQIGFELHQALSPLGPVTALNSQDLDLNDPAAIRSAVQAARPGWIVNAAAYTQVDQAETEPDEAHRLNVEAPAILAEEARRAGAVLVHYSTDYVFDGKKRDPYVEADPSGPINVYGRTKWEGEQAIARSGACHFILRTSWIYGRRGRNFLNTLLRLAKEREELKIVDDQIGAPTWCKTVALTTAAILKACGAGSANGVQENLERISGVYHMTCGESTSWFGFAQAILQESAASPAPRLIPIPTRDYPTPAKRPAYSVLSNEKLHSTFGCRLPSWREALHQCLQEG